MVCAPLNLQLLGINFSEPYPVLLFLVFSFSWCFLVAKFLGFLSVFCIFSSAFKTSQSEKTPWLRRQNPGAFLGTAKETKLPSQHLEPIFERLVAAPKRLFFQDLKGLTEVFAQMSAGVSGPKLPLWADISVPEFTGDRSCNLNAPGFSLVLLKRPRKGRTEGRLVK